MPITIQFTDGGTGMILTATGTVDAAEMRRHGKGFLSAGEKLRSVRYALVDYSQLTQPSLTANDIEALAASNKRLAEYATGCAVAVVAEKDSVFGMARMWETLADVRGVGWETIVVRSRREAEEWIRARMRERHGSEPTFT